MSTRPVLPRLGAALTRSVMHHARPPRVPPLRNPHETADSRPTEGTSTPHPANLGGSDRGRNTSSTTLGDTNLTLHYSPPPTAPSYTTGNIPDLIRWTNGEQIHLTGEEKAPLRRERRAFSGELNWDKGMVAKMTEMRAIGRTRSEIAKELNIPAEQQHLIARVAPLSAGQVKEAAEKSERQKETWGKRKTIQRAIRERRKEFW